MFSGVLNLSAWECVGITLILTHITIASVTIFLHRHQAHRALELHPIISHFFRFWLWITTGIVTKQWAAVHRKHHAKCETAEDPHSPQFHGVWGVLFGGLGLYRKAARDPEVLTRFGHGCPNDWLENNIYTPRNTLGILTMLTIDVVLFGVIAGPIMWGIQMLWIPFWAAGVVNGIGHYWGYRNFEAEDTSTNLFPIGIIIGGEELHNNHHAYASSAKLSSKWYEFDIGWMYIQILSFLGLAKVKKLAPKVRLEKSKHHCDFDTVRAVITHRYEILKNYGHLLKEAYTEELRKTNDEALRRVKRWLNLDAENLAENQKETLKQALGKTKVLTTIYEMRQELIAIWQRSAASKEQLVKQLEDWCHRAESSGITALKEFSQRLRCYAA